MLLDNFYNIKVAMRNVTKIRNTLMDSSISIGDVLSLSANQIMECGISIPMACLCDQCGASYSRDFDRLSRLPKRMEFCGECMQNYGNANGRKTRQSEEHRTKMSSFWKQYFSTEAGKEHLRVGAKNRQYIWEGERGEAHRKTCADNMRKNCVKYGENHHNYNPNQREYDKYKGRVAYYTYKQDLSTLENSDKPRGLAGVDGAYQIDHMFTVKDGFSNKIPPNLIADIKNLQIITWEENNRKRDSSSISLTEFLQKFI